MNSHDSKHRALAVLAAGAVILILAGTLVARALAPGIAASTAPPAGAVPQPLPSKLSEVPTPFCWGCAQNQDVALQFQIDLDLLAPLGDGPANAAEWFKDFAEGGSRFDPSRAADRKIEVEALGTEWSVLPGDDPLLLEAEPWIDQATCRFYPDIWKVEGLETRIPQLLMMLDLARSWVVRGALSDDPESAHEDYRRAIRLGRLLRQDDATLIQDLVAIAAIRIGAEALYHQARDEGDATTMLLTSRVLADKDAMRQITARRITVFERAYRIDAATGQPVVNPSDKELDSIVELIHSLSDRRFLMEGLIALHAVRELGPPEQARKAREALTAFEGTEDPIVGGMLSYFREHPITADSLKSMLGGH